MSKQRMRYVFIRFMGVVYHTSTGRPYKLAVFDGWTQVFDGWALVGDGWANAHPGPPLAPPVSSMG